MSDQEEHDHEQGQGFTGFPPQEWDWLEVPAIICRVSAGTARCIGQGLDALAFELQTAATWRRNAREVARQEWAEDVARAEMAGTLEGLVLFAGDEEVEGP